jgi:hypothetical protein
MLPAKLQFVVTMIACAITSPNLTISPPYSPAGSPICLADVSPAAPTRSSHAGIADVSLAPPTRGTSHTAVPVRRRGLSRYPGVAIQEAELLADRETRRTR